MTLEVKNMTAGYGDITVLRDVNFEVPPSRALGVLGRNGMGKTTLIRALSGLIIPDAGHIRFQERDITHLGPDDRAKLGLTTVIQGSGVFPDLTVRQNLIMGRIASGTVERDRMDEVFEYFPRLEERITQNAGTLSGGERKMLEIGCAVMTDPSLMMLDEPSDGIMPTLVDKIAQTLQRINREEEMTIVIVEQNLPMAFHVGDEFIILEKGQIVARGTQEDIEQSEAMQKYLVV